MPTSLDVYLPFDAGAGANVTEDSWRKMARYFVGTGPIRNEDNEMQVIADSTGMQVKVKTGKAFVRGHYGEVTTQRTLPITAAHATLARIDVVVLRADFTNNRIELDVLPGTAAGSPVAPSLTQSTSKWEIALAQVAVGAANTTITAGQVTDRRELILGSHATGWTTYTPTWTGATTNPSIGNGILSAYYRRDGDELHLSVGLVFGSTTGGGVDALSLSLPVAHAAGVNHSILNAELWVPSVGFFSGYGRAESGTSTLKPFFNASTTSAVTAQFQNCNSPGVTGTGIPVISGAFTIQSGGWVWITGSYRIAP